MERWFCAVGYDYFINSSFHKQCERIYLSVFWQKNRLLSWASDEKNRNVSGKSVFRPGILSDAIYRSRISDDLHWCSTRLFQLEYYGDGCENVLPAYHHLPGDLFQYCAGNQCDGKYADGYSLSGWNVLVWYCVESDSCSLWTVILADLLPGIPV